MTASDTTGAAGTPPFEPSQHDAAVHYAGEHGFYVVPLHHITDTGCCSCGGVEGCRPGKHPVWRDWLTRATNDPEEVSAIWTERPNAGIGLLCGRASNLVVLDVDSRNGGYETLFVFLERYGDLPDAGEVITGGGGAHFYFAYPAGVASCPTRVLGPGLELRADSALVVAPPTIHASGSRYEWDPDAPRDFDNPDLPDLPDWALEPPTQQRPPVRAEALLQDTVRRKRRARAYLAEMDPAVSGDGGDAQTWAAVLAATAGFALDGDDALDALSDYNARCVPPWAPTELLRKVQAAMRSPLPRGYLLGKVKDDDTAIQLTVKRRDGSPECCAANAVTILTNDPQYRDALAFDAFRRSIMLLSPVPRVQSKPNESYPRPLTDDDILHLTISLQPSLPISQTTALEAIRAVASRNTYHPVRSYLSSLVWDGESRLDDWLTTYLGAGTENPEIAPYLRAIGPRWMISAVARVFSPGAQVDSMIVLEGPQGAGKSSVLRTLAGDWFTDDLPEIGSKDAMIALGGVWIVEVAELDAFSKVESTRIKSFVSRRVDHFRPPYGRTSGDFPRQCIFAGTTNSSDYLRDPTGARRFWPVSVGIVDLPALARDRDQLWGEAYARYLDGESWWLNDKTIVSLAQGEQEARFSVDPWEGIIAEACERQTLPEQTTNDFLTKILGIERHNVTSAHSRRLGPILARLGFEKRRRTTVDENGKRPWVYRR